MDATTTSDDEIEPPAELIKRRILQNLVANAEYVLSVCHFSPELFALSLIADRYSSFRYPFIRELLPLPVEGTIQ
jgi:hypothetical protein